MYVMLPACVCAATSLCMGCVSVAGCRVNIYLVMELIPGGAAHSLTL